jgi:hypothetical protein
MYARKNCLKRRTEILVQISSFADSLLIFVPIWLAEHQCRQFFREIWRPIWLAEPTGIVAVMSKLVTPVPGMSEKSVTEGTIGGADAFTTMSPNTERTLAVVLFDGHVFGFRSGPVRV